MSELTQFHNTDFHYNQEEKDKYHKIAKKELRRLAKKLGLVKGQFDVRSNMAGIAVAGEVTLHTEKFYLHICENFSSHGLQILYRSCKGLKDYSGGTNQWEKIEELLSESFFNTLQKLQTN